MGVGVCDNIYKAVAGFKIIKIIALVVFVSNPVDLAGLPQTQIRLRRFCLRTFTMNENNFYTSGSGSSSDMLIRDAGDIRKYYYQIQNIVDDMHLDPFAFRLYSHFKRVAGEKSTCYQSTNTLATACDMSMGMVSKARNKLLELKLIEITTRKSPHGVKELIVVTICDLWTNNIQHYTTSHSEIATSPHEINNNPLNKNPNNRDLLLSPDSAVQAVQTITIPTCLESAKETRSLETTHSLCNTNTSGSGAQLIEYLAEYYPQREIEKHGLRLWSLCEQHTVASVARVAKEVRGYKDPPELLKMINMASKPGFDWDRFETKTDCNDFTTPKKGHLFY